MFSYQQHIWSQATATTYGFQIVLYVLLVSVCSLADGNETVFRPRAAKVGVSNFPGKDNNVRPDAITDLYVQLGLTITGTSPSFAGVNYAPDYNIGP